MRHTILTVLLAACIGTLSAQDIRYDIQKSEIFETDVNYSSMASVAEDDEGGLTMAYKTDKGYTFQKYNGEMQLVKEQELKLRDRDVINVIINNEKAIVVDFTYNKKAKAYICSASVAAVSDLAFTTQELFTVPAAKSVPINFRIGSSVSEGTNFATLLTDKDKLVFAVYVDIDDPLDENDSRKLAVYNTNLELTYEHPFANEGKKFTYAYQNLEVTETGTYLLAKVYTRFPANTKAAEKYKYYYEMLMLDENGYKKQLFDTEKLLAKNLRIVPKENAVCCTGFYSNYGGMRAEGVCYYDMDPVTLDIRVQKFHPFSKQLLLDKFGQDIKQGLPNLEMNSVFLTPDNNIIINAEEIDNGSVQNRNILHFDDIVTAALDANGDLLWTRGINKEQWMEGTTRYLSYTSAVAGENTYFFFNSGEKPKDLGRGRIEFGHRNTYTANLNIIRVNQQGQMDFKEILPSKDSQIPFMTAIGLVSKKGDMIYFLGEKDKKKQLLKVSIIN